MEDSELGCLLIKSSSFFQLIICTIPKNISNRDMSNSFFLFLEDFLAISYNELGYTTLSVAESRRDVSVGAPSCIARSVTEDNVPLGRARARVPSAACQPKLVVVA